MAVAQHLHLYMYINSANTLAGYSRNIGQILLKIYVSIFFGVNTYYHPN